MILSGRSGPRGGCAGMAGSGAEPAAPVTVRIAPAWPGDTPAWSAAYCRQRACRNGRARMITTAPARHQRHRRGAWSSMGPGPQPCQRYQFGPPPVRDRRPRGPT